MKRVKRALNRRVLSAALAAVMLLPLLTGCGGGQGGTPVETSRPAAPDVTVKTINDFSISTSVSKSSSHFGDLHYYLFPDASYREEEKHDCGYLYGRGILRPGTTYYVGVRGEQEVDGQWQYSDWTYFAATIPEVDFGLDAPAVPHVTTTADSITVTFDDPVEGDGTYWLAVYEDETHLSLLFSDASSDIDTSHLESGSPRLSFTWKSGVYSYRLEPGTTYYLSAHSYGRLGVSDITYFTATTLDE